MVTHLETGYPLSPIQEGILFYCLYAPNSDPYISQLDLLLEGELDVGLFEAAWQAIVDRHEVLRTSFHWDEFQRPIQIPHSKATVSFQENDWREIPAAEQERAFQDLLTQDRFRGLDLASAPLMRFVLCHLGEREFRFLWTYHHLLIDGWSISLLLKEVFSTY